MQPLSSMTGFARSEGQVDSYAFVWELRSVNARGLDLRLRLPTGWEGLEPRLRKDLSAAITRGAVSANLAVTRAAGQARLRINTEALDQILRLLGELQGRIQAEPPRLDGLLALRGVLEPIDGEDGLARPAAEATLLSGFQSALQSLIAMRRGEGAALGQVIRGHLDEIASLTEAAAGSAALQPSFLRGRLRDMVAELLETAPALPEERLAQEAALLVARADATEEIDRLRAHAAAARELVGEGGAVGRRLDFLCQELNREANTLCSKSADLALTRTGLALKAAIEQLREQVQNIE